MRYAVCSHCGSSRVLSPNVGDLATVVATGTDIGVCGTCVGRTYKGVVIRGRRYVVESDDHDLTKLHALAKLFASASTERPDGTA